MVANPMSRIAHYFKSLLLLELMKGLWLTLKYLFRPKYSVRYPKERIPQSAHFLGQAYRPLGKREDEEKHLRRGLSLMEGSLELNSDDARDANLAAGAFASLGDAAPAFQCVERSLPIGPAVPMPLSHVA